MSDSNGWHELVPLRLGREKLKIMTLVINLSKSVAHGRRKVVPTRQERDEQMPISTAGLMFSCRVVEI